ncbi:MAG: hypothetical protein ACR2NA_04165 [Solirubrobacterales bacterium]
MDDWERTAILAVVVGFGGFFALLTIYVLIQDPFSPLSLLAILVLILLGVGALGASRDLDDRD